MKFIISIAICTILLSSCFIKGLKNGYKQLSKEEKNLVIFDSKNCIVKYNDTIYAYNAKNLKECLKNFPKTMIYVWDPNCSSKSCISLYSCQKYCDRNGYELIVLLEYFDIPKQKQYETPKNSLVISDFKFYKSNFTDKAVNELLKGLTERGKNDDAIKFKRFFFFTYENFEYAKESLLEI